MWKRPADRCSCKRDAYRSDKELQLVRSIERAVSSSKVVDLSVEGGHGSQTVTLTVVLAPDRDA